jgi:hypothetical protein
VFWATADSFAVLGGSTVMNTGLTTLDGDLGVWPGTAITGFPPGLVVGGSTHTGDVIAMQAQADVTTAYNVLAGLPFEQTWGARISADLPSRRAFIGFRPPRS